jgi:hypothetical protein
MIQRKFKKARTYIKTLCEEYSVQPIIIPREQCPPVENYCKIRNCPCPHIPNQQNSCKNGIKPTIICEEEIPYVGGIIIPCDWYVNESLTINKNWMLLARLSDVREILLFPNPASLNILTKHIPNKPLVQMKEFWEITYQIICKYKRDTAIDDHIVYVIMIIFGNWESIFD